MASFGVKVLCIEPGFFKTNMADILAVFYKTVFRKYGTDCNKMSGMTMEVTTLIRVS